MVVLYWHFGEESHFQKKSPSLFLAQLLCIFAKTVNSLCRSYKSLDLQGSASSFNVPPCTRCGGGFGKRQQRNGGAERVVVRRNGWHNWKEEENLGGGAHQGQNGWSKITGATDL
ncbi:hypothetical protein BY996DRAFT_6572325 [Phakopsora pachyrhizi]|nr:hypothetical protein BY996DRAFT_6572325 [Phakopsora pachyrhizi]